MTLKSPQTNDLVNRLRNKKYVKKHLSQLKKCDGDSFLHSVRVGTLAVDIAEQNNLSKKEISIVGVAGLLHDIGKCDIPKDILTKKSMLSPVERKEIEKHPRYSFDRLKENVFTTTKKVVVGHHEYTHTPYPRNSSNGTTYVEKDLRISKEHERISFLTQILAVADIFDALSSGRVYKKAYAKSKVRQIMTTQFTGDKKLIEQALERY